MTSFTNTSLTKQEIQWIKEQRFTRLTDNQEALIYPMGAERYLSLVLFGNQKTAYNILNDIKDKEVLVIPGYGNTAFLFAQAGASSVVVYDKDPVTIAWVKAFKKYYHYRQYSAQGKPYPSVGELLAALTSWYPPLLPLPRGFVKNALSWVLLPKTLRRTYLFYLLALVAQAIESTSEECFELNKNIMFFDGELNQVKQTFHTVYVPYLLGVSNGIESEKAIVDFVKQALRLVPKGRLLITPCRNTKEFHLAGKRYFMTTGYASIKDIPDLSPYFVDEDPHWFTTQGLVVFEPHPMP